MKRRAFFWRSIDLYEFRLWHPVKVASEDSDWAIAFLKLNIGAQNCFADRHDRTLIMDNNDSSKPLFN